MGKKTVVSILAIPAKVGKCRPCILPLHYCSAKTGLPKHESSGAARSEYQHKHNNMTVSCSERYKTSAARCEECGGECVNNRSKDSSQIKQFNIGRTKSM